MVQSVIGFAGMTHLGLVSSIAGSERGFEMICFDTDETLIDNLQQGKLPISEPNLDELVSKNKHRLTFTCDPSVLQKCDTIFVAPDVPTDDQGKSDLAPINGLLDKVFSSTRAETVIVVLSQVPPGFTRSKVREGRILYYQVETLIFGCAVERALYPERYIVGCDDPSIPLPKAYATFLGAHNCPILPMRYESAELAKISINMCLVASVSTANTLAELCEKIGANWSEIVPALKLDRRIGQYSYLAPGLGISGGNLERDLATVCNFADEYGTDAGIVRAWLANSKYRKNWPVRKLREVIELTDQKKSIAIWGIAYKENTHSIKNSPALVAISELQTQKLKVYDPIVKWDPRWHSDAEVCSAALDALHDVDALLIMTPWDDFKKIDLTKIVNYMRGKVVIDPYGILGNKSLIKSEIEYYSLGK